MSQINFLHVRDDETGDRFITVFVPGGGEPKTASHASHPNFDRIYELAVAGDPAVLDLFDVGEQAATRFLALTERISVANGHVFLDGDEINTVLTRQIVRFLEEGVKDWQPLVNFFELVLSNPNEHSREQLYEWLDRRDFTITPAGYLIGYKGVRHDGKGGYESITAGPGIVDGVACNGHLPNNVGSTVEIARSRVQHDPSVGCASGLHVGDYDYARNWAQGGLLKVEVNPRDIVSVPTDCNAAKVRVCRYTVLNVIETRIESAVDYDEDDYAYEEDYCA